MPISPSDPVARRAPYRLDAQVGFLLRQVSQRHSAIFAGLAPEGLTPTQFAVLVRLAEHGALPLTRLGQATAMDAATLSGVVARLAQKKLVAQAPDPADRRRTVISLSAAGRGLIPALHGAGRRITEETLAPLDMHERRLHIGLLARLA